MLRSEHIRSKVYGSYLEVLRKLATCSFWFRRFKDKSTLRESIQGFKTIRKLQRRYLEVKKQEGTLLPSLKRKKQYTRDVFSRCNK